ILAGIGCIASAALFAVAGAAGWHAARAKKWSGRRAVAGGVIVALLHVLQPLARARGWLKGWRRDRGNEIAWPAEQKLWGNLTQRGRWLDRLLDHVRSCGWL